MKTIPMGLGISNNDKQIARLFRALTHPSRLAILDLLRHGEQCVCHLEFHLGKRQAYISQQLMFLREAELVDVRRDGLNCYYRVTDSQVFSLIETARAIYHIVEETPRTGEPHPLCPCPKCTVAFQKP